MKVKTSLVHPVAEALLLLIGQYEFDQFPGHFETSAFYNGRERAVCITVHSYVDSVKDWSVVFGENRNSDQIFVDEFDFLGLNPPTAKDLTEAAYRERQFFAYNDLSCAFTLVQERIKSKIRQLNTESEPPYVQPER